MSTDPRESFRKSIYDVLDSQFPAEYGSALHIQKENSKRVKVDEPFLATYIIYTSGQRASIGTGKRFVRHTGFFCIEVQVPEETGMSVLWKAAGACERAMAEQQLITDDGSVATLMTPKAVGNTSQDGWYFVTVMVPFMLDACMT